MSTGRMLSVMSNSYKPRFPVPFRKWRTHDLAFREGSTRPWFYEGLRKEQELLAREFIEENYLSKYRSFVGVRFEWGSDGLWSIPFPGSVGYEDYLRPDDLDLPLHITEELQGWHDEIHALDSDADWTSFDWETSDEKGLSAAKEVKLFLEAAPIGSTS
jgi:hypothetical protein